MTVCSCANQKYARDKLEEALLSSYMAETSYCIQNGDNNLKGSAIISSGDNVRLDFISPESLNGVSIECDANGDISSLSLSFSGIKADLPKSTLQNLSLAFCLFSKELSKDLSKLSKDCFEGNDDTGICKVTLQKQGFLFEITYNKDTGIPVKMTAKDKDNFCTFEITKFKKI